MTIKEEIEYDGKKYFLVYSDSDDFSNLERSKCKQVYGICYVDDTIVVVFEGHKKHWGLPGGAPEEGENLEDAIKREVLEEANMQIISLCPIGYQKSTDADGNYIYQLRYVCKAKALGKFKNDPDGDIVEIKLINPNDYKQYFDWGKIGERIMERSAQLKTTI